MPRPITAAILNRVKDRDTLFGFLQEYLGWPVTPGDVVYDASELEGVELKSLIPFTSDDPFDIYLIESGDSIQLDLVRRAAQAVRNAQKSGAVPGKPKPDLVFICAGHSYADVRFVKYVDRGGRRPKLASFGWTRSSVHKKQNNTMFRHNLPALRLAAENGQPKWEEAAWNRAWDTEPVTQAFYKEFEADRGAFLKTIPEGLSSGRVLLAEERHWLASLVLNRLMFVWFLADGDRIEGLRVDIKAALARGNFYRDYFLPLCVCALGRVKGERAAWETRFERVPYLNGGLFEIHDIERAVGVKDDGSPGEVTFDDSLFRKILSEPEDGKEHGLFLRFNWTLDEAGEEATSLSPHILGYVFERHINGLDAEQRGQKKNGAYYTKEDVTGYIARSTIIPRLFDKLEAKMPGKSVFNLAFLSGEGVRRYIYTSLKTPSLLPKETYDERERRLARVQSLEASNPQTIDEFTVLNLDSVLLAEDFIGAIKDPEVLWTLYLALKSLTVVDPTVGSGAFLLAALEVLAPLYRACLVRMEDLIRDSDASAPAYNLAETFGFVPAQNAASNSKSPALQDGLPVDQDPKFIHEMRKEFDQHNVKEDPEGFLRKSIVLSSLFGVDLMSEAVEICKLRLSLALLSGAKGELEPLPDLEFNIVPGNTLVGFESLEAVEIETQEARKRNLEFEDLNHYIPAELTQLRLKQERYRKQSLGETFPHPVDKSKLRTDAEAIRMKLDDHLFQLYRHYVWISPRMSKEEFRRTHRPLHWPLAFPTIGGSFDVIIGNPPWVETSTLKGRYSFDGYKMLPTGNLYALVTERAIKLLPSGGRFSFIVQLPLVCADRMKPARKMLRDSSDRLMVATFDDRPAKLFEHLEHCRSTVFIMRKGPKGQLLTTRYQRWHTEYRPHLIESIEYARAPERSFFLDVFPKSASSVESEMFGRLLEAQVPPLNKSLSPTKAHYVFYQEAVQYWVKATVGWPGYRKNDGPLSEPGHGRYLYVSSEDEAYALTGLLNSSLFYVYFVTATDCFHLTAAAAESFPMPKGTLRDPILAELGRNLMRDLHAKSAWEEMTTSKGDKIAYEAFYARHSKHLIDQIDDLLAAHYGLTPEELKFVKEYDEKFRVGIEADNDPNGPG